MALNEIAHKDSTKIYIGHHFTVTVCTSSPSGTHYEVSLWMEQATEHMPELCSNLCRNWPLRQSYNWAKPSCPLETNQLLLTKDTLNMAGIVRIAV